MRQKIFSFLFSIPLLVLFLIFFASPAHAYTGGYVFPVSAKWGESVDFHLSSTGSKVKIEIFRQGIVQEKVALINSVNSVYLPCEHHSEIGCFYPQVYSLALDADYRPGLYLAKFINLDSPLEEDLAYFVVKPAVPGSWSKIAVVLPLNTWEVHNFREGKKVYPSPYNPGYEARARSASFLRPWQDLCSTLELGYPMAVPNYIWWLESHGYYPEYITDIDLDQNQKILNNYQVGISIAHHEYWSWGMRDAVENYINQGGNFLFLSGNVSWWQVRYEDNYSLIRVYKLKEEDPYFLDNDPTNDHLVTVNWKDSPVLRPETLMTGTSFAYGGFWEPAPVSYEVNHNPGFRVYRTKDAKWGWIFSGANLNDGDVIGKDMFQQMTENDGTYLTFENGLPVVTNTGFTKTPDNFMVLGISDTTRHGASYGHAVMGIRETLAGGVVFTGSQEYFGGSLATRDPAIEKILLNLLGKLAPDEQKPLLSLPFSAGGLRVFEFTTPVQSGQVEFQIESDLCTLNAGKGIYWIWVLTDPFGETGSFYYSLNGANSWFSLSSSENNPWSIVTDPSTGFPKSFNLSEDKIYQFNFSPRITKAKIQKIIFTNVSYFYPARLQFEDHPMTTINLPSQLPANFQPKFVTFNPSQDSYIHSWYPNSSYGGSSNLIVKNDGVNKAFLNFDLTGLPKVATINRAFLKLFLSANSQNYPVNVGVSLIKKNWLEKEINWQQAKNNLSWQQPGASGEEDYDSGLISTQRVQGPNQWYYFDVTSQIRASQQSGLDFSGLMLFPFGQNSGSTYLYFFSQDYPQTNSRPVLEINYQPFANASPSATPTAAIPTLTPTSSPPPTPTPTPTVSPCQISGSKVKFYSQDGDNWLNPPNDWQANFGQSLTLNQTIKLEEIKIKLKNYGGGQKGFALALTPAIPPSDNISGTVPCCYYQGWVSLDLSQRNVILEAGQPYFIWIKDTNGYPAFAWAAGSVEIWGKECLSFTPTLSPTTTPTPTPTPTPTATPSGICQAGSVFEKTASYEFGSNPRTLPDIWSEEFRRLIRPSFSGKSGQLKIGLRNWGGGTKTLVYAITEIEEKPINGNFTYVIASSSFTLPGSYNGWLTINLPGDLLFEPKDYYLWLRGQNSYNGAAWICNSTPSASGQFQLFLYRCQ